MNDSRSTTTSSPLISNRLYDTLKWIAQILLPAIGALYFGLGDIWNLPKVNEVVGTLTVIDAFLGVLLGASARQYNNSDAKYDGTIDVLEQDETKLFSLNLDSDPDDLENKDEVLFKVNKDEES